MNLSNQSDLPTFFSPRKVNLKIPISSVLRQAVKRLSSEDGFRLVVSSNPLLRFKLVVIWDLVNLGKLYSGIRPFLVRHLLGFGQSWKVMFWIRSILKLAFQG
jgi:hypothetical protein